MYDLLPLWCEFGKISPTKMTNQFRWVKYSNWQFTLMSSYFHSGRVYVVSLYLIFLELTSGAIFLSISVTGCKDTQFGPQKCTLPFGRRQGQIVDLLSLWFWPCQPQDPLIEVAFWGSLPEASIFGGVLGPSMFYFMFHLHLGGRCSSWAIVHRCVETTRNMIIFIV